jgi:hypothetical protein
MLDWFVLAAAVPVLLLVLLFSFLGCTLLFDVRSAEDSAKITVQVQFDPSLGGEFNGVEWPPLETFDVLVRIHGTTVDVDEVALARPNDLVGNGLIEYAHETTLRPGDYDITCQVHAPARRPEDIIIVRARTCNVAVAAADRTVSFSADLGSNEFNPC